MKFLPQSTFGILCVKTPGKLPGRTLVVRSFRKNYCKSPESKEEFSTTGTSRATYKYINKILGGTLKASKTNSLSNYGRIRTRNSNKKYRIFYGRTQWSIFSDISQKSHETSWKAFPKNHLEKSLNELWVHFARNTGWNLAGNFDGDSGKISKGAVTEIPDEP